MPYFTKNKSSQRLILHISKFSNALFYIFQSFSTPYFTYSQVFQRLILHIPEFSNALFYIFPPSINAFIRVRSTQH